MRSSSLTGRFLAALGVAACVATGAVATATAASAACTDIDISFARGTGEAPGLGIVGGPFTRALTSELSGYSVSTYAVNYAANVSQSSAGPGATDMSNHISSVAAQCPNTRFVIGGYSQGATVTSIAAGIRSGFSSGTPIPANLAGRVAAVVVFGNPLGLRGGETIATASPTYGPKSRDYCNSADTVCGSQPKNGSGSHLSYASNGSTTAGAQFAAGLVRAGTPPTGPTDPTDPEPPATVCVQESTRDHVDDDRAVSVFGRAYARGSRDSLGATSRTNIVSLQETGPNEWELVPSC